MGRKKYNIDFVKKYCKKRNIEVLDSKYIGANSKLKCKCLECNYKRKTTFSSIKNQNIGCPKCYGNIKHTMAEVKNHCKYKNIQVLTKKYINAISKMNFSCNICGHIWKNNFNNIKNHNQGCPKCNRSKSEQQAVEMVEILTGRKFQTNAYPKWLKNPKTGYRLELDGYNKELKIAIEYQGVQHFKPIKHFGGKARLDNTQYKDNIKRKICKQKGIILLEPNYKMDKKDMLKYIKNQLDLRKEMNCNVKASR